MKLIRRLALILIAFTIITGCATVKHSPPGTATTIVLTRHGDRDMFSDALNATGLQRAQALVEAVSGLNITAIYHPDLNRNKQTAQPLAQHLGITPQVVNSQPNMDQLTPQFLNQYAGQTIIWIGNKHNLQRIYSILGAEGAAPTSYGDLYIVNVRASGAPEVIKKRYGP